ncbi:hypothetical protein DM01DRAFT_21158 [Hesseltinella vesiculosa]|uniref:Uncharacterized protein n=1 Tax=Hesseltinella vesiculosa TaxID=101127 RepID=A0A1X2GPJ7_9FUNG|nr:hypothetical protein DM01DRAFT_21158 [Hesseltinella vesiculosa]
MQRTDNLRLHPQMKALCLTYLHNAFSVQQSHDVAQCMIKGMKKRGELQMYFFFQTNNKACNIGLPILYTVFKRQGPSRMSHSTAIVFGSFSFFFFFYRLCSAPTLSKKDFSSLRLSASCSIPIKHLIHSMNQHIERLETKLDCFLITGK